MRSICTPHIFDMREGRIVRELVSEMRRDATATAVAAEPTPEHVMQLGLGVWG